METYPTLYIIYMISAPLLVVITAIGLYQLKLLKDESKSNSENLKLKYKRESILLAHEKIDYYYNSILILINEIDKELNKNPLEILTKSKFTIENNTIIANVYFGNNSIDKFKSSGQFGSIIDLINKVEYFSSIVFTKTIDEDIVFKLLSSTYISSLEQYIPLIITIKGNDELTFENTLNLYFRWYSKSNELKLNKKLSELNQEKSKNYKVSEFKPLGTD